MASDSALSRLRQNPILKLNHAQRLLHYLNACQHCQDLPNQDFWQRRLKNTIHKLLKTQQQNVLDAALDLALQQDIASHRYLLNVIENLSSSYLTSDSQKQLVLLAIPIIAWTRFSIPAGILKPNLQAKLEQCILPFLKTHIFAQNVDCVMVPALFAAEHLPDGFGETVKFLQQLGTYLADDPTPLQNYLKKMSTEEQNYIVDLRFIMVGVRCAKDDAIWRWQEQEQIEPASDLLANWQLHCKDFLQELLPACGFQILLPDFYYRACHQAEHEIRPLAIGATIHYLTQLLNIEASELEAIVAPYSEQQNQKESNKVIDEYRISFFLKDQAEVIYGAVWPFYENENPHDCLQFTLSPAFSNYDALNTILKILQESGVQEINCISDIFDVEHCDDCGSVLLVDREGELAHPEMPDAAEDSQPHFH